MFRIPNVIKSTGGAWTPPSWRLAPPLLPEALPLPHHFHPPHLPEPQVSLSVPAPYCWRSPGPATPAISRLAGPAPRLLAGWPRATLWPKLSWAATGQPPSWPTPTVFMGEGKPGGDLGLAMGGVMACIMIPATHDQIYSDCVLVLLMHLCKYFSFITFIHLDYIQAMYWLKS